MKSSDIQLSRTPIILCDAHLFFDIENKNKLRLYRWKIQHIPHKSRSRSLFNILYMSFIHTINRGKHGLKISKNVNRQFAILKISFAPQMICHMYCKYMPTKRHMYFKYMQIIYSMRRVYIFSFSRDELLSVYISKYRPLLYFFFCYPFH